MKAKQISALLLAAAMTVCAVPVQGAATDEPKVPKYIFLFIGDGMSSPQIQTTNYYLNAVEDDGDDILTSESKLNMMKFPVVGSAQTYDSTSFCPDSASTATSISTGHKTYSGTINMDEKKETSYETIAEKLYQLAEEAGYKVIKTKAEAEKLTADDGKAIVIDETLADDDAMSYDMDLEEGEWGLSDYVEKGIEVLNNDKGFFMMVEGGKIDWACHANDAAATITDTIAMDEAIGKAVDFYNEHPDETLILTTGDHETGGLTIGFAGTDYDTFLANISNQKISYAKFDSDYVAAYKENKTDFDTVMTDITELFGLQAPAGTTETTNQADSKDVHPESADDKGSLVMTDYEYQKLQAAYEETMSRTGEETDFSQEEYLMYGSYEPLTVTITHILNNKSGINFSSYAHTGLPVEVFAMGAGQEQFEGYYDNTDIFNKMAALTGVK